MILDKMGKTSDALHKNIIRGLSLYSKRKNITKVLMAISGGADSAATASFLLDAGLEILALHCNFNLRGEESHRDQKFVENFCSEHKIPLEVKQFNVNEYISRHKGCSLEMACRNLRYHWFNKIKNEKNFDRIVTGHTADDNIETFLLNLLRGSGSRGLAGMKNDNGLIWRPLLEYHRNEFLPILETRHINFIVDSSNLKNDYRRNFLRNDVIPLIKSQFKGFDKALDKTIANLRDENKIIEASIAQILGDKKKHLDIETIIKFPAPKLLVKRFIDPLSPFSKTPDEVLDSIIANKPHIRKWKLRNGNLILRNKCLFIEMIHGESGS